MERRTGSLSAHPGGDRGADGRAAPWARSRGSWCTPWGGKLVHAAGDAAAAEFERRFG
ncbi:MAG: hypothetical protein JO306_07955 [Gemmatimonadetes bacterium]|nr:hypothetical protein [Gemmatimonadota bacterium]